MVFQVNLRVDKDTIKTITLPTSGEDTGKLTAKDLKKAALSQFPGVTDPNSLTLTFNGRELEDDNTLEHYGIKQLSVIHAILIMPGGEGGAEGQPPYELQRTQSTENFVDFKK